MAPAPAAAAEEAFRIKYQRCLVWLLGQLVVELMFGSALEPLCVKRPGVDLSKGCCPDHSRQGSSLF